MKKSVKFNGKKNGLYDFVSCVSNKSIEEIEAYLVSKGWEELEVVSVGERNGYETYSL
jgi:phosphoribosyl-dephospho-CoA transferase